MTLTELKNYIKREFGYPMIKVELHDDHLTDVITDAYSFHLKWGIGISTQEVFLTMPLSAGVREYTLPTGVYSVINVKDSSSNLGGSQELFSLNNAIYMQYQQSFKSFNLVSYEIAMQFIDLLEKYDVSKFNWTYHNFQKKLLLYPTPTVNDINENSYMLIRCFLEEGYRIDDNTQNSDWKESLYDDPWFKDYCVALSKIKLGLIRRKMANFSSLGNQGISLDGDSLVSEGKEEKEALEEEIKNNTWEGLDIFYD